MGVNGGKLKEELWESEGHVGFKYNVVHLVVRVDGLLTISKLSYWVK